MRDRHSETGARYVRTQEAARMLDLSARTLEKYRCHGTGPTFRKLGGRVVYLIDDLEAWAEHAACNSTSDPRYAELRIVGRLKTRGDGSANNARPDR